MSEQGGLIGAGGRPRRSGATRAACSLPGPGPELRGCARGTPPDPGVSVWLGLCSAAALSDTRPTPSHGSQVGLPLPSLPAKCCVCPHTSPRGQDPSDSVLAWPGSTTALLLAQGKLGPNRGQMSTSSFKGQGWTKRGPQSSCSALDRSPHGAPFRARGSVHTEGSAFPWPAPAGLTGTHQGPALATRKQRDFPWRRLGSALSPWAACWHHGRAVGVGGGWSQAPWQFQDTRTSSAPSRAQAYRAVSSQLQLQTEKPECSGTAPPGDLPPGHRTAQHLTWFSVSGIARLGLRHSSENLLDVKELFCCPAQCSRAGVSQAGSEPHPRGFSKEKGSSPDSVGSFGLG